MTDIPTRKTMSMFATQTDYWKDRAETAERELAKAEESDRESIAMYHRARERAEQAEQRAKAAEEDAERLLFLVREDIGIDQIGDLDIHAQAAEHAAIKGHDEPTDDDYIASIRTAIDAARKKDAA